MPVTDTMHKRQHIAAAIFGLLLATACTGGTATSPSDSAIAWVAGTPIYAAELKRALDRHEVKAARKMGKSEESDGLETMVPA